MKIKVKMDPVLKKKLPVIVFALIVLFLFVSFGTYFLLNSIAKNRKENEVVTTSDESNETYSPIPISKDIYSTVLLGRGGEGHSGGTLTDTIIQVFVDPKTKRASLISIPRDLWVSIPTDFENKTNHKINEAFAIALDNIKYANKKPEYRGTKGAGQLTMHAVSVVTGIEPDYYVDVDFGSFERIVDLLGGITINSAVSWDDYFYPVKGLENETCGLSPEKIAEVHELYSGFQLEKQFECRYEHIQFSKGKNTLDGDLALKYVRSRHSDTYGGDFARSEKQFAVLSGILQKIISKKVIPNGGKILKNLFSSVNTNLSLKKINELASILGDSGEYEITKIRLTADNVLRESKSSKGQYILVPREGIGKWDQVQAFVSNKIN